MWEIDKEQFRSRTNFLMDIFHEELFGSPFKGSQDSWRVKIHNMPICIIMKNHLALHAESYSRLSFNLLCVFPRIQNPGKSSGEQLFGLSQDLCSFKDSTQVLWSDVHPNIQEIPHGLATFGVLSSLRWLYFSYIASVQFAKKQILSFYQDEDKLALLKFSAAHREFLPKDRGFRAGNVRAHCDTGMMSKGSSCCENLVSLLNIKQRPSNKTKFSRYL